MPKNPSALRKLDLRDRTQLAIWAVQTGAVKKEVFGEEVPVILDDEDLLKVVFSWHQDESYRKKDILRFRREWEKRGAVKAIPYNVLEELLYDPGMMESIQNGILIIDDMGVKKALGLEPEDATEPVNIIILNDKQKENLLKNKPFSEFKQIIKDMPYEQVKDLADFAIANEITNNLDKCDLIKQMVNIDIIGSIQLQRMDKEA